MNDKRPKYHVYPKPSSPPPSPSPTPPLHHSSPFLFSPLLFSPLLVSSHFMARNKRIAWSYRNERSNEKEKKSFRFDDVSIPRIRFPTSHKLQSSKSLTREYETARTTVSNLHVGTHENRAPLRANSYYHFYFIQARECSLSFLYLIHFYSFKIVSPLTRSIVDTTE